MNGPHDMGGEQNFGPVRSEPDEPVFHAAWEKRAMALSIAMNGTGLWNIDMVRHARERIPPPEYLNASYYEKWTKGLERLLVEHGLVTRDELKAGGSMAAPLPLPRRPSAATVPGALARGAPFERPTQSPALYKLGDAVRAKTMNPLGHTRLPRYVRGRTGRIAAVHGAHVFPDSNASGRGEDPQWLYSVSFAASELWGLDAKQGDETLLDLWEPYLEPA